MKNTQFSANKSPLLYYDSPGGACRALTFALARLSCIDLPWNSWNFQTWKFHHASSVTVHANVWFS